VDILIQSPRIKLSNRLERIVQEKFERFDNPAWRIIRCEVLLRKEKSATENNFVVEAKLVIPGNDLFARKIGAKFEIAAEDVCTNLERQLSKRKTKLQPKTHLSMKRMASDEELE
jgi:putative sigma-54 modulation protein